MENLSTNAVRVLIKHVNPLLAVGLSAVLRERPHNSIDVFSSDLSTPAQMIEPFDVVISDLEEGLSLLTTAKNEMLPHSLAKARLLIVASEPKPFELRTAIEAGAFGFVLGQCTHDELREAVDTVARGNRYICKAAAQGMADSLACEELTARQLEVLYLLTQGRPNKLIARELGLTIGTVKSHVKHILGRLGVKSRMHAVSVAIQRGIVSRHATNRKSVSAADRVALRPIAQPISPSPLYSQICSASEVQSSWRPH